MKVVPNLEADWQAAEITQRVEGDACRYRITVPVHEKGVMIVRPSTTPPDARFSR